MKVIAKRLVLDRGHPAQKMVGMMGLGDCDCAAICGDTGLRLALGPTGETQSRLVVGTPVIRHSPHILGL